MLIRRSHRFRLAAAASLSILCAALLQVAASSQPLEMSLRATSVHRLEHRTPGDRTRGSSTLVESSSLSAAPPASQATTARQPATRTSSQRVSAPAYKQPRTPWGDPDLQGSWSNATVTPLERPAELGSKEFFTPAEAAEYAKTALQKYLAQANFVEETDLAGETLPELWGEARGMVPTLRTSLIVGPTGRVPALTPEARSRAAQRAARLSKDRLDGPEERPLNERCLYFSSMGPAMLPSITYNSNYEIIQTPTAVVIQVELGPGLRIIPLDRKPHLPGHMTQWLGDSRGHWEGNTLVVDTTNVSSKRELRGSTDGLHVVEHFTRTAADMLMYRFTASDPSTWVEPWTAEIPMRPLDGELYEYACHEGDRSMESMLRAARKLEAEQPGSPR